MIWKVLGIEKTKDVDAITAAYREKLHYVNPEDDQEGFKELRRAYEEALSYAQEVEDAADEEAFDRKTHPKNDVDRWLDRVDKIYEDVALRRDEEQWKTLFRDPVCDDLDTELEAGEKLLAFIMQHSYMPQNIWQLIDKRFDYRGSIEQLKERFPENFLNYVVWQIEHASFIDFDLFEGDTSDHVDDYINKIYDIKGAEEERDFSRMDKLFDELESFGLIHPYLKVERAMYLMLKAGGLTELMLEPSPQTELFSEDEILMMRKQAMEIMEELDFELSSNVYIHRIYGETLLELKKLNQAEQVYNELLERDMENYSAMIGLAKCAMLRNNPEDAKEKLEDILEERVQDGDCLALLEVVNVTLVNQYESELEGLYNRKTRVEMSEGKMVDGVNADDETIKSESEIGKESDEDFSGEDIDKKIQETTIKLGWCYYQQREFEKGIRLLDRLPENDAYDYVNLRCRLYLANEEYEKAYPWTEKWLSQIENSVDDGSREMAKRKNRLSLAHFSLGVCMWENEQSSAYTGEDERDQVHQGNNEAVYYLKMSIDEENNRLVKMSYMEQLAKFYLSAKQYEKCIDECTEIIEMDPGFFPAYVHRQRANYELKNAREVVEDYFACVDIYPEYVPPYVLACEVYFAFDQYEDIEDILKKADEHHLESDALELYRIRVTHYKEFNKENLNEALSSIIKLKQTIASRKDPDSDATDIEKPEDVEREHALLLWDLDKNDEAIAVLDRYMEKHSECISLLNLKVDILNRSGKSREALDICRNLYENDPSVYNQTRLGMCYERMEQYENAKKNYEDAYNRDSEYHVVVRRLMYLYSFLSDRERDLSLCKKGIFYATKYIELTDSAEGYVERGNLYIDLYELDKAVEDCRRAIELDPEAYYAYNNLGCALLKLRRADEAIEPLQHAIELDRTRDHLPFLNLAESYTVLGEYEKAIVEYKAMLEIFPKHTYVWKDIVPLYLRMGKFDKAIAYYEKEIDGLQKQRKEQLRKNLSNLPHAILNMDDDVGAGELLAIEEKLMDCYCDLADVHRQAGDVSRAKQYYNLVLKRWKNIWKARLSIKPIIKIAEFYRDQGELAEAKNLIQAARWKMTKKDLDSKVREDWYFQAATIYFELHEMEKAKDKSDKYMLEYKKRRGSVNEALEDARYRCMNLYNLAIMSVCGGDLEAAKKCIDGIRKCHLCVVCEHSDCFEYHFGMGLIAELEGRFFEAKEFYEKAIAIKGDYPCAKRHLELVEKKCK